MRMESQIEQLYQNAIAMVLLLNMLLPKLVLFQPEKQKFSPKPLHHLTLHHS